MSRPGAEFRQKTMLDRLRAEGATGFGINPGLDDVLADAVDIEASEPFEYLRERTQDVEEQGPGGDLSAADSPDCHPEGLARVGELSEGEQMDVIPPVFFEGSFPAGMATAFDPRPGEAAGIMSNDLESLRAGALVVCTEDVPDELGLSLPESTRYILRITPYVDLGVGVTEVYGPPIMWLIPVSEDGAVLVDTADQDIAIFVMPSPEGSDWELESGARVVHQALRAIPYGALFSMRCVNTLGERVMVGSPSSCGIGTLYISSLTKRLDGRGKAKELGLGHALTVCRRDFGPIGESQ